MDKVRIRVIREWDVDPGKPSSTPILLIVALVLIIFTILIVR